MQIKTNSKTLSLLGNYSANSEYCELKTAEKLKLGEWWLLEQEETGPRGLGFAAERREGRERGSIEACSMNWKGEKWWD